VSRKYSARLAEIVAQQHARRRLRERQGYVAMIEMLASDSARRLMLSMLADELEVRVTAFTQLARIVPLTTPEVLDARSLEEKIVGAGRTGAFLALTVDPCRAPLAEAELLRRFTPRERISLEALLLREMHAEAEGRKVKWPVVLAADAEGQDGKGFRNILRLATKAAERMRATLLAFERTGAASESRPARAVRSDAHAVRTRAGLRHEGRPSQPMAAGAPTGCRRRGSTMHPFRSCPPPTGPG